MPGTTLGRGVVVCLAKCLDVACLASNLAVVSAEDRWSKVCARSACGEEAEPEHQAGLYAVITHRFRDKQFVQGRRRG